MKTVLEVIRISAGRIDSNNQLYANAIIIDENVADMVTPDRIDVGQQHAKVRINTDNENRIATLIANSGLVPGKIEVDLKTSVKGGEATVTIVNFTEKKIA